ncbi:hypothetical protein [Bryobacter aggregatus]|uniref:hypothetical protein n=1 Tax=Bryobacter aggregatus TaxID=360054 RepID=UPI0004E1C59C|nr:hypothetical protein [Bryobacter aggregatus]
MCRGLFLFLFLRCSILAQIDVYPEIRALLREAETAFSELRPVDRARWTRDHIATLYSKAGYFADADRVFGAEESGWPRHLKAFAVYGRAADAEKLANAMTDPEVKAQSLMSLADVAWKMGQPGEAKRLYQAALAVLPKYANVGHRANNQATITRNISYLGEEPPYRLSAVPTPRERSLPGASPVAPFPITTDGFRSRDSKTVSSQSKADNDLLERLFERMRAQDREGLNALLESAQTPFQKTLGFACIEHILIQLHQPEAAESFANQIPESTPDTRLAKAEAMRAVGAEWLRLKNLDRARTAFSAATAHVQSAPDLVWGQTMVLTGMAAVQARYGMSTESARSFELAVEYGRRLPLFPTPPKGGSYPKPSGVHYRDEGYRAMLIAAIEVNHLAFAQKVSALWSQDATDAATSIVNSWLQAGMVEPATLFARQIKDPQQRTDAFIALAKDRAFLDGVPNL